MDEEVVQKIVMDEKMIQKIVMDEELVQNGVMDRKIVKNFVMGAKIDPKVVMDLPIFKIGGWNIYNPVIEKCWKKELRRMIDSNCDENEPWLPIRIPSRDLFLTIQYLERQLMCDYPNMKESKWQSRLLMLLCEGLCELPATLQRQHFAAG